VSARGKIDRGNPIALRPDLRTSRVLSLAGDAHIARATAVRRVHTRHIEQRSDLPNAIGIALRALDYRQLDWIDARPAIATP
jgi:hypothetical protein